VALVSLQPHNFVRSPCSYYRLSETNNCAVCVPSGKKIFMQDVTCAAAVDLWLSLFLALNGANILPNLQVFTMAMFGSIDDRKLITWSGL
jgi:hypothetical protein